MEIRRVVSPVLFGTAALCFFLPFGTASCEGETSTFTGVELVTWSVDARDEFPGGEFPGEPAFDLAWEIEKRASILATLTLAAAVAGFALTSIRWRPGLALVAAILALLSAALMLLVGWQTLALDAVLYGYWLTVALLGTAIVWHAVILWRRRRRAPPVNRGAREAAEGPPKVDA